jgi:hypothetical protein
MNRLVCGAALFALALAPLGCKTRKPKAAPAAEVAGAVKAGDLMKEYGANAVAADGKYKGKVWQVSGKFGSAKKVPLMGYMVQLEPEDAGEISASMIQCVIVEEAQAAVAQLKTGQKITVQGTCDGEMLPGQVKFSKCTLVQ